MSGCSSADDYATDDRMMLGYQSPTRDDDRGRRRSHLHTSDEFETVARADEDLAKMVFRVDATEGTDDAAAEDRRLPLVARRTRA